MADVKISELPSLGSLAGTEEVPVNDGGTTKKVTTQDIADLAGGISSSSTTLEAVVVTGKKLKFTLDKIGSIVVFKVSSIFDTGSSSYGVTATLSTGAELDNVATTIPSGYRPVIGIQELIFPFRLQINAGAYQFGMLLVNPDGTFSIRADQTFADFSASDVINFDDGVQVFVWSTGDFA
jgi:hypothetical protein